MLTDRTSNRNFLFDRLVWYLLTGHYSHKSNPIGTKKIKKLGWFGGESQCTSFAEDVCTPNWPFSAGWSLWCSHHICYSAWYCVTPSYWNINRSTSWKAYSERSKGNEFISMKSNIVRHRKKFLNYFRRPQLAPSLKITFYNALKFPNSQSSSHLCACTLDLTITSGIKRNWASLKNYSPNTTFSH